MLIAWCVWEAGYIYYSPQSTLRTLAKNFIAVSVIPRQGFIRLHAAKRNMRHFHGPVVPLFTTIGTNQERRTELFILNCCFQGDRENRKNICVDRLYCVCCWLLSKTSEKTALTEETLCFPRKKLFSPSGKCSTLLLFLRLTTWMLEELYPLILHFTQFWSLAMACSLSQRLQGY